jgi:transposase
MIEDSEHYSAVFKKNVVSEVLSGKMNKDEAKRVYGIRGKSTVLRWIRKFESQEVRPIVMTKKKSSSDLSKEEALAKVKELEKALRLAEIKAAGYSMMIDIAEKELKVPIRKKLDTK